MRVPTRSANAPPPSELYSQGQASAEQALASADGILRDGVFQYEVISGWAKLPAEIELGEVAAVAVGPHDTVVVFARGEHPIIVFDKDGNALRTAGEGAFKIPHGLHIGPDGTLYCTDAGDHTVRLCTPEGRIVGEIGVPNAPSAFMSGQPFRCCTHTTLSPQGDLYVSDGYGNACIHKFSPDGHLLKSWGRSGCAPGEFYIPHNIVCDEAGWVYVADRENHRVQVFDGEGHYEAQWNNLHRPCALCRGRDGQFVVGELGPFFAPFIDFPNLGPRLVILDQAGNVLARLSAGPAGLGSGQFIAPHGVAVDSSGDIYVAEVSRSAWPWVFPDRPMPASLPSLHKLRRVNQGMGGRSISG